MPHIRVLQSVAGLDFSWSPGEIVDVDKATAAAWADGERAELVEDKPQRTTTRTRSAQARSK